MELREVKRHMNRTVQYSGSAYELTAIISSDAHDPRNLVDGAVRQAEQLAADWGITVTPKLTF